MKATYTWVLHHMQTTWDVQPAPSVAEGARTSVRPPRRGCVGFTLAELLIAGTLGAVLLIGTAMSAGMFGQQVQALKTEVDQSKERAFSMIADDLRYAWSVETPNSRTLHIDDPAGRRTSYQFANGELWVTQPDGSKGMLVDSLKSATFTSEETTRYREDAPASRGSTVWSTSDPLGSLPSGLVLGPGDKLALGFTASSLSPIGKNPVEGIDEQLLSASLDTLEFSIGSIFAVTGTLYADLYRARSPDDARPSGASLGQVDFNTKGFNKVKAYVWDTKKDKEMPVPKGKAWGWWESNKDYELIVEAPLGTTKLDIAKLNASIQPGYAYTIVLQVVGGAGLAFRTFPVAEADGSGVARSISGGPWSESPIALSRSLSGIATSTQAEARPVVDRVRIHIKGKDGNTVTGYASIAGQSMIAESWLGAVAGEVAP